MMSSHNQHAQTLWSYYGPLIDAGVISEIKLPTSIMQHIGIEGLAFIGQRFRWAAFLSFIGNKG